jgi:hypothetical protein
MALKLGKYSTGRVMFKPEKCEFLQRDVSYLGHVIAENGVLPDKVTTKMRDEFPTPQNAKQLKSFLELMSYCRLFIPRVQ